MMETTEIFNLLKSVFNEGSLELKTDVPVAPIIIVRCG